MKPAVSLVESCTDVSELPWTAATSNSEVIPAWGCSPFSPHLPQLTARTLSLRKHRRSQIPGFMWQDWAYNSALAPRTSLSCAAQKHTPEAGRAPGAAGNWCPDPAGTLCERFLNSGRYFFLSRETCRSCSCQTTDVSFSDPSGVLGPIQTAHPKN